MGGYIEKAEKLLAFVSVSSDGSDIDSDSLWVTQAAHDTYSAAIVAAQTAAETGDDDVIIAAIEALQEATFRFHAEKEQGGADIGTLTTYQELLDALNAIQDGCAVYKGEEDYGDQHYEVIQITKPITIDQVITVPYPIKLQFNADITINGRIIIEGCLIRESVLRGMRYKISALFLAPKERSQSRVEMCQSSGVRFSLLSPVTYNV